jgi:hypothetical protein
MCVVLLVLITRLDDYNDAVTDTLSVLVLYEAAALFDYLLCIYALLRYSYNRCML